MKNNSNTHTPWGAWNVLVEALRRGAEGTPTLMTPRLSKETGGDPFRLLIAVMLSARARDESTEPAVRELFSLATAPDDILRISHGRLQKILRPVGMYRQKTQRLRALCRMLIDEYDGCVPDTRDALVRLPGVGRKTANLVLVYAFGTPAIAVDTHVHRLSNALGLVDTKRPEQTERALMKIMPKRYWAEWNRLLVTWGKYSCPRDTKQCIKKLKELIEEEHDTSR